MKKLLLGLLSICSLSVVAIPTHYVYVPLPYESAGTTGLNKCTLDGSNRTIACSRMTSPNLTDVAYLTTNSNYAYITVHPGTRSNVVCTINRSTGNFYDCQSLSVPNANVMGGYVTAD